MKLAAIQFRPPKGQPDRARDALAERVTDACQRGAKVVVCPEMATTGYVWASPAEIGPLTEEAHGPTYQRLSAIARDHGSWVICGFAERFVHPQQTGARGGRVASLFNSALVILPDGQLATCYRKVLLYDADKRWANPGHRRPVCPADFGRLAPGICMDINDPRYITHLRETRPDVVAFCTNWISEGLPVHGYWQERLAGWKGWFIAGNSWGEDGDVCFSGESAILAPGGQVVAQAPARGDTVLVYDAVGLGMDSAAAQQPPVP